MNENEGLAVTGSAYPSVQLSAAGRVHAGNGALGLRTRLSWTLCGQYAGAAAEISTDPVTCKACLKKAGKYGMPINRDSGDK